MTALGSGSLFQHEGQGTEPKHSGLPKASVATELSHWPYFYVFEMGFHVAQTGLPLAKDDLDPASSTSQVLR